MKVVLADDHPPTRAGVRQALEEQGHVVVAEVSDAPSAVAAVLEHRPDVCLLDINMPGSGINAAARICEDAPDTAVVMLTVSQDDDDIFDALRAGAVGYLLKDMDPDRLAHALEGVLRGEAALPRPLVLRVINEFRQRDRQRDHVESRAEEPLSAREWDVLELLREHRTTARIAEAAGIAPATVRSHIAAILRKLRVSDRAEAIRLLDHSEGGTPDPDAPIRRPPAPGAR